jgi:hypothetical protein
MRCWVDVSVFGSSRLCYNDKITSDCFYPGSPNRPLRRLSPNPPFAPPSVKVVPSTLIELGRHSQIYRLWIAPSASEEMGCFFSMS